MKEGAWLGERRHCLLKFMAGQPMEGADRTRAGQKERRMETSKKRALGEGEWRKS